MTGTMRPEELMENAVVDAHGKKIGKVGTVYVADNTQQPEWITVRTGLFGQKESFVPLRGSSMDQEGLHVQVSKEKVSEAPRTDGDRHLSDQESMELYRFYDMPVPRSTTENREAGQSRGRASDDEAMTRSEERLRVGKEEVETGRVKLRKYAVTEEQQVNVPVTHEEVRLEREPITDADRRDARITDDEQEVTLHSERPHVEKETVPVERVHLEKDTVTDEETVSGEVRKEQVDVDDSRNDQRRKH